MSANNYLSINKKTFEILEADADTGHAMLIATGKSLEDAIELAEKYMEENIVEYGIHFHKEGGEKNK